MKNKINKIKTDQKQTYCIVINFKLKINQELAQETKIFKPLGTIVYINFIQIYLI